MPHDSGYRKTVEAFVVRARRIRAHSLAQEYRYLEFWADGGLTLEVDGEGGVRFSVDRPPEEILESLAARVRPLVLQQDRVYYGKVFKALGGLLHVAGHPEWAIWVRTLRKHWESVDPSKGDAGYFLQELARSGGPAVAVAQDTELANAWLYGDLVHADEHSTFINDVGIIHRYMAATISVCRLALLAGDLLDQVSYLRENGFIELDAQAFECPVKAEPSESQLLGMFVGEEGAVIDPGHVIDTEAMRSILDGDSRPVPPGKWRITIPWEER